MNGEKMICKTSSGREWMLKGDHVVTSMLMQMLAASVLMSAMYYVYDTFKYSTAS